MKQAISVLGAIILFSATTLYADFGVEFRGAWPESWPHELESLRKQSRTLEGPFRPFLHYAIPFTNREQFEAAWPHLLKVKTKGAPIVLRRGPSHWFGSTSNAGVCIHTPPKGEAPTADAKNADGHWQKTIYIELIVDGDIVDLNRIPLPADTPIIDERFKDTPPRNDRKPAPERSNVDRLKVNPDDVEALKAYLGEMERSIKFLADQDQAVPAGKQLDEMKSFLESLEPQTEAAKQLLNTTERLLEGLESTIGLARMSLAELEAKLDANPRDPNAFNNYTTKVFRSVYRVMRSDPDQAEAEIKACRKRSAKLRASADESLRQRLDQLEKHLANYDTSIAASRKLLALVGTDAVPLNVAAWINGESLTDADLKGKVVLLDFTAVWCGPCIRKFPKLREWHEKYSDKGLVIIGLTDYFNFAWNEESSSAQKLESEVSAEQEQAMLQKFAKHHDLPFRLGIQVGLRALDSEMAKHYMVNGFPCVVIIDQAGKVRLLRTGGNDVNTKDIGELLEKLLGTPAEQQEAKSVQRQARCEVVNSRS